jgi:addiction module HigA family antidote
MADHIARRNPERRPTHPGAMLNSTVLPALGRTKTDVARLLGLSRQSLYDILAGKQPVTPETAVKLGKLCGNGPVLWLNMQTAYDLWQAERDVDVSNIPTLEPREPMAGAPLQRP